MIFINNSTGIVTETPPPIIVINTVGFFILILDVASWTFPTYAQWDIQYSTSANGVDYGEWIYGHSVLNTSISYNYIDVDVSKYYQFRYSIRSRAEISMPSVGVGAGRPATTSGGSGGESPQYEFDQTTPQTNWVITHNLNSFPDVLVLDNTGVPVMGDITYNSSNQVSIFFTTALAGKAYLTL